VNLFYQPLVPQGVHHLDNDESRHCTRVLRRRNGDHIRITDGSGSFYDALITDANPSRCEFSIQKTSTEPSKNYSIHIAIAPTKNPDRIEWFVEKATEFGIDRITFLRTEHSEKVYLKKDRLIKVAISAMKQSLKASLPAVGEVISLSTLLGQSDESQKFIAYVDDANPAHLQKAARPGLSSIVLIGPEGDFATHELTEALSYGFEKVSLGKSRLRTETAGVAACHILNLINS
jgi:16S rRNA (uracil1498-N3)-methyltransferase